MKIKFRKMLLCLTSILALGIFMGGVSAEGAGDVSSDINPVSGSGCSGKDSCWLSLGENKPVYGIRVSIVDSNGNLVSGKSMDYLGRDNWTYKINNNTNYYRFKGTKVNRLAYINGQASSTSMSKHDGTTIAKTWKNMPDIFHSTNAASAIENAILSMTEDKLNDMFFKDLNYTPKNSELKNHYMIIEPLTMVSANGKTIYYGTYYELTKQLIKNYNYENSNDSGKSWIASVLDMSLPLSLYIKGNSDIKGSGGYDANSGSYFNGKLLITKDSYQWYQESKDRWRVKTDNVKNAKLGYGIGIIWMGNLDVIKPTCDYNNPTHFSEGGPNGEDCCEYVLDNIDDYGISKSELFTKYPRCGNAKNAKTCNANLSFNGASCNEKNTIEILDKFNWECMWESAYSNDDNWRNYFLVYGDINASCSISCAHWVDFEYPSGQIDVLAGNRFSISSSSSSYSIGINPESNMAIVNPATLGPIMSKVTKNCVISGDRNACLNKVREEVSKIEAPTLSFEYESEFYTNPKMTLAKESVITNTYEGEEYFRKELTTYYKLPDDTYKYVSKQHGISFKNTNDPLGLQPYDSIGPHAPIHFGETGETNYIITIDKFNIDNFDDYIKDGKEIASKYETSIETYIQRLIELGELKLKNVNGIYYFSDSFTKLLENPQRKTAALTFTIDNFLSMSCANTDKYSCSSDGNGIYCIGKEPNANPEDTYNHFRTCINNFVKNIKFKADGYFKQTLNYSCNFNVIEGSGSPNINVIFRQISLNNPFPGKDGDENGRDVGVNWSYAEDSSPTNEVVTEVITNNRGVKTEKVYKELDPLYKITLTPALIKRIREYNKDNPYVVSAEDITDKNQLVCTNDKCLSPFIRDEDKFKNEFSGCGITNASVGLTCASNESW